MTEPRRLVHHLGDRLEAARLKAIELLASQDTPLEEIPADVLRRVADLHIEIEGRGPRLGYGGERPLE